MAIKEIYSKYFQKSKIFLYPLLDIKKGTFIVPKETYISLEDKYTLEDMKLICMYNKIDFKNIKLDKNKLYNHNRLIEQIDIDEESNLFIFDFSDIDSDWNYFLQGKYSKIKEELKRKILNYFDKNSANYKYIKTYLYPKDFFNDYAVLLDIDVSVLETVGELCSKPNIEKETLKILVTNMNNIKILD